MPVEMARSTVLLFERKLGRVLTSTLVRNISPASMCGICTSESPVELSNGMRSYASRADDLPGQEKVDVIDVKKSTMSFEKYRKLKKSLIIRRRIAGLPMAFVGASLSSYLHIYLNPRMFEMTPEEIQPIM